jgi:hypothetical protein
MNRVLEGSDIDEGPPLRVFFLFWQRHGDPRLRGMQSVRCWRTAGAGACAEAIAIGFRPGLRAEPASR